MLNGKFWKGKNVFVTGASGLVGSWLVRTLVDLQAQVIVLIRDQDPNSELIRSGTMLKTRVINGSLENIATIERAFSEFDIDTVFHLGAQTLVRSAIRNPLETFESNIRGTYHILEVARRNSQIQRILIASSDKAYGSPSFLPYLETHPLNGRSPYDVSKSCSDLLSLCYAHSYRLPVVIARCGNIYGGGDLNWSRLIPGTIKSLLFHEPPEIRSNGLFVRDYLYVEDAVDAYLKMAEHAHLPQVRGEPFNFSPNKPTSVFEIVEAIQEIMGSSPINPIVLDRATGEIDAQWLDSTKAAQILGWTPNYSLTAGLEKTIAWYRDFFCHAIISSNALSRL